METKICTKCKEVKSLDSFHNHKLGACGKDSVCKLCKKDLVNYWNNKNKEDKISLYI